MPDPQRKAGVRFGNLRQRREPGPRGMDLLVAELEVFSMIEGQYVATHIQVRQPYGPTFSVRLEEGLELLVPDGPLRRLDPRQLAAAVESAYQEAIRPLQTMFGGAPRTGHFEGNVTTRADLRRTYHLDIAGTAPAEG